MIRASTRLFGLLGHPVSHSLSPAMHNAALRATGVDAVYLAFDVAPRELEGALAGARALGAGGLNLTVPHKERGLALAAEADPLAEAAGAANTLVPAPGGWKAYNTDVSGFVTALAEDLGFRARGRRCLVLGAGGAARAAVAGLLAEGAQEIFVANRNEQRARRLVADLSELGRRRLSPVALERALGRLAAGDLLVSATPVGLRPDGAWPWDLRAADPAVVVYDMAYRPEGQTCLVRQARAAGLRASSGRSMLLHQGALAFALWTGRPAPLSAMAAALGDPDR
ncbi:MAG: shikimate dehydrogenase [Deferrisomatales bacterium]